jgi:hypothetical protein
MTKVLFQDKPGNAPITVAFVSFRESRSIMRETANQLIASGIKLSVKTDQRIVAENGANYWLA